VVPLVLVALRALGHRVLLLGSVLLLLVKPLLALSMLLGLQLLVLVALRVLGHHGLLWGPV
jgi:hypothetical protein